MQNTDACSDQDRLSPVDRRPSSDKDLNKVTNDDMEIGKIIVTTQLKKEAVNKLSDFWGVKSMLLKTKHEPLTAGNTEYKEKLQSYLDQNSQINEHRFWNSLNKKDKDKASELLKVQEMADAKFKIDMTDDENAEIFVVLDGKATVTDESGDEQIYGKGEVFGSLELFNKFSEVDENGDPIPVVKKERKLGTRLVSIIHHGAVIRGTLLRMTLNDFRKFVAEPEEEVIPPDETEQDQEIAGIPFTEMTEDDKFYVNVFKRAQRVLNPNIFSFLDSYRLIARNSRMSSYKHYKESRMGYEFFLGERDPRLVFIVLDGALRLDIISARPKRHASSAAAAAIEEEDLNDDDSCIANFLTDKTPPPNSIACTDKYGKTMTIQVDRVALDLFIVVSPTLFDPVALCIH